MARTPRAPATAQGIENVPVVVDTEVGMHGVFHKYLTALLVVALCALCGCTSTKQITSVEGPLTPYSPVAANPAAAAAPATTTATTPGPYNYDPADVDPTLLDKEPPKLNWFERMTEATAPKRVGEKFKILSGRGPDEEIARHNYNEADLAFREGNYEEALKRYKVAADRWPDSPLQEDALYMIGESYYQLDRYPRASNSYTKLIKKYENSRYLDMIVKRRFAIGRYWEQRDKENPVSTFNFKDKSMPFWDTTSNTVAIYESIRMDDPTGPLADDATMATANTLFLKGRWEDAAYHYDLMRTEFPQSEFQAQAILLGMQSKLRSYQGPHYDAKPLQDAKKLGHLLQTQFAAQVPNERENIQQTLRNIDAQLAERDWSLGEFYHTTRHYTAAKYYYNEVVKQYPQSKFADLAKNRIEEVKDKPQDPKNEIEWIASKFRRAPVAPAPAGNPAAPAGSPPTAPDQPFMAGQPPTTAPQGPSAVARQPQDQR
jgi:outer membrane protein assembly factor BamD (BamD/ComL family)